MAGITQRVFFFMAAIFLVAGVPVIAQQNTKRLVLKDGSYQTVTKWEMAGDRLRYYSAERYDWEEIPAVLVDWPATEKYNQENEGQRSALAQRIRDRAGTDKDEDAPDLDSPAVAPGLRLPDGGGVFLLDTYQSQRQLAEVAQNGGELNRHTGRNILRAAINPLSLSSKQTIELEGEHAKVQSHVTQPAIFVDVETAPEKEPLASPSPKSRDSWPAQRFAIIHLEKKNGKRVIGNLNVSVVSGKMSQKENLLKTTSTVVGHWIKIAPVEALAPGEYAVVELLEKGQINLYVWDFGVDPSAPANPNAWTARPSEPAAKGEGPVLERRPN